jgi:hypothetical protein
MNKRAEKLLGTNPAEGNKALAALASLHRVSPQEHARLAAISRSVSAALDKTDETARAYVEGQKRRNQALDDKELRQFSLARLKALGDGIRQMGEELSPASWNGLRAYINADHRDRIFKAESRNGKTAPMTGLPVRR